MTARCIESPRALLGCIPVNPWLLGAMGKGLCCIASWCSLVSCGEIAAEEDCESEREGRERNGGNGKHRKREEQNKNITVSTDSYIKNLQKKKRKKKASTCHSVLCVDLLSLHGSLVSDYPCVLFILVYVGYPLGIPPKCRLHLLVMPCRSLQGQGKVTIHKEGSSQ